MCGFVVFFIYKFFANVKMRCRLHPLQSCITWMFLLTSFPFPGQWIWLSVLQRSPSVGQSPVNAKWNKGWHHLVTVGQQISSCWDTGVGTFLLHDVNLVRTFIPPQASNQRSSGNRAFFQAAVPVNKQKLSLYCLKNNVWKVRRAKVLPLS